MVGSTAHRRIGSAAAAIALLATLPVLPLLGTGTPAEAATGFSDVGDDHPFATQIVWMVDQAITKGYDDGTFRPGTAVSRQSMAAFLHRVAGSPAPPAPSTFTDVPPSHPFAPGIAWMVDAGVTSGYSDNTFRPQAPVSRQGMAAFLYRAAGQPAGPFGALTFSDVPAGSQFAPAIAWMVDAGITTGYSDNTFRPEAPVSRQSMAAFLYRALANPLAFDLDAITIGVDPPNPGDAVDCTDFADWATANRWFQWFAVHGDPAQLDPDAAGPLALCPDLPGAPPVVEPTDGQLSDDLGLPPQTDGNEYSTRNTAQLLQDGGVQTGVTPGAIDDPAPSILRGRVVDPDGEPLPGVEVSVVDHPEYGTTTTRDNGRWDLASNPSPGPLVLRFAKAGRLAVQRRLAATPGDFTVADDVVMTPLDPVVTNLSLGAASMQVAPGSTVVDDDGTRRNLTLIPAGTTAELVLADGTRQPAPALAWRATEYTVGDRGEQAMPASLPTTSGYTYAVELSADQALAVGASVEFNQPIVNYVDNFLGFPAGSAVPAGWYDADTDQWRAAANGVVVDLVSETAGKADLDVTGDGAADTGAALTSLGITDAERTKLAELHQPGTSLWRVPVEHLTPWDYNWPYGCQGQCAPPPPVDLGGPAAPQTAAPDPGPGGCEEGGSIIRCYEQALADELPVAGSDLRLAYESTAMPGSGVHRMVTVPIAGGSLPTDLERIEATIAIGGQLHQRTFDATPYQEWDFSWDGLDAFGRPLNGPETATLTLSYVYDAVYKEPAEFEASFAGAASSAFLQPIKARGEINAVRQASWTMVGTDDATGPSRSIGGWRVGIHHRFSPQLGEMTTGDGDVVRVANDLRHRGSRAAGNGDYCYDDLCGENELAWETPLEIKAFDVDTQGRLVIVDGFTVRRVDPTGGGNLTTIAGLGGGGAACPLNPLDPGCGVGGPANDALLGGNLVDVEVGADGAIHLLQQYGGGSQVLTIGTDGILRHTAGQTTWCPPESAECGDGGPATDAYLDSYQLAVGGDGTIYVSDTGRIRAISADGTINRVVGCVGGLGACAPGPVAGPLDVQVNGVHGLATAPDGSLLFVAGTPAGPERLLFRLGLDGNLSVAAGHGACGALDPLTMCGVGGPALDARIPGIGRTTVDRDGRILVFDGTAARVLGFEPGGMLEEVAGDGSTCEVASCVLGDSPLSSALPAVVGWGGASIIGLATDPHGTLYVGSSTGIIAYGLRPGSLSPPSAPAGSVHVVPDPDGRLLHHFDLDGRHLATQDLTTMAIVRSFTYDADGRLTGIADAHGNTTAIERDVSGVATAFVSAFGQRTELGYSTEGMLDDVTYPGGRTVHFSYALGGMMTQRVDPGGAAHLFTYDPQGRLATDTSPDGVVTTLTRTGAGDDITTSVAVSGAGVTTYRLQRNGDGVVIRTVTSPGGAVASSLHDPTRHTTTLAEPDGSSTTTTFTPDTYFGGTITVPSLIVESLPGGATRTTERTRVTTSEPFQPLAITTVVDTTTVEGRTTTRTWDAATRTVTSTSPAGRTAVATLDPFGDVVTLQPGDGLQAVHTTYDAEGFATSVTAGARTTTLAYDASGYLVSQTDDSGDTTSFTYNDAGERTSMTLPSGRVVGYGWDVRGNQTSLDLPGTGEFALSWTAGDQAVGFTAPGLAAETRSYDSAGRLASVTTPAGQQLTFGRDAAGRITSEASTGSTVTTAYLGASDRPATATWTPVSGAASTLAMDWDGPLATGATATGATEWAADWTWDTNRWLTGATVSAGATTDAVTLDRDDDGLLTSIDGLAVTHAGPGGAQDSAGDGTVSVLTARNSYAELTGRDTRVVGDTRYRVQLTRDDEGRVTAVTETLPSGTNRSTTYAYDVDGRVVSATVDGAPTAFAYDADGNPTTGPAGATTFDIGGRATSVAGTPRTYDGNGRLATRGADVFTYLPTGELRTATVGGHTVTYSYDALGRRAGRGADGVNTAYVYADPGNPLRVTGWRGADGQLVVVRRDADGFPVSMEKGTSTWYLGTDHLGTIRVVTDAAGVVVGERTYDTWGRLVADTAPGFELPLGFADGLADPLTGLVRFGARDYDPATGTWTAPDPARFAGGVNLYGYAGADPVNRTDPTGRWCVGGSAYAGIGAGAEYCRGPDGSQSICMEVGVGIGAGIGISNGQPADTGWGVGLEASASCGPIGISGGLSVTRNECPDGRLGKRQAVAASKAGFGPVSAQVSTQDFENNTPGQLGLEQGGGSMDTRPGCGVAAKANLKRCVKF